MLSAIGTTLVFPFVVCHMSSSGASLQETGQTEEEPKNKTRNKFVGTGNSKFALKIG